MRFYKSTHCSLMLSTLCLGVNAVRQGLGTCQQLLCVRVQRTFRYFFKTVSDSFLLLLVSGIYGRLCMCVCLWEVKCLNEAEPNIYIVLICLSVLIKQVLASQPDVKFRLFLPIFTLCCLNLTDPTLKNFFMNSCTLV